MICGLVEPGYGESSSFHAVGQQLLPFVVDRPKKFLMSRRRWILKTLASDQSLLSPM